MAKKKKTRTVYRDSITGRFVTAAKVRRSRTKRNKRYKKVTIKNPVKKTKTKPKKANKKNALAYAERYVASVTSSGNDTTFTAPEFPEDEWFAEDNEDEYADDKNVYI